MCLIVLAEAVRLDAKTIGRMYETNDKGAGIAWREDGMVHWRKGLNSNQIIEAAQETDLPYAVHFRTPSQGTSKHLSVCHPFPISADVDLSLTGSIKGQVLFHNGFWHDWRKEIIRMAVDGGWKLPDGSWSDSRALALVAHHLSTGVLGVMWERVLVFGHNDDDIDIYGDGWSTYEIEGSGGKMVLMSNEIWDKWGAADDRLPAYYYNKAAQIITAPTKRLTGHVGSGIDGQAGGTASSLFRDHMCGARRNVAVGEAEQKEIQESHENPLTRVAEKALDMLNFVRGKNISSTKPPVCSLCGKANRFITTLDGIKWRCTNCVSIGGDASRKCIACRKEGNVYFMTCWRCWSCHDTYQKSLEVTYQITKYTCCLCKKEFPISMVVYYDGRKTGTSKPLWQCYDCYDRREDRDLAKKRASKGNGVEIVGPLG